MSATKRRKEIALILSLIVLAFGFYYIFLKSNRSGPEVRGPGQWFSPKSGEPAPDFILPDLDGNSVRLADYRGKVVFLNFWATWCPPCIVEMPSMESLYQKLKGRQFEILAISIDQEGADIVRPFMKKYSLTFPAILDPEKKAYRLYRLTAIPETFIIDKNGVIDMKIIGPQNWTEKKWLDYFDRIIGEK